MDVKKLVLLSLLYLANIWAFFFGGYYVLRPWFFVIGLVLASAVCFLASLDLSSDEFAILTLVTILTALLDEYVHTQHGIFNYYDGLKPSPLTVFGWGVFIISILKVSSVLYNKWGYRIDSLSIPSFWPSVAKVLSLFFAALITGYIPVFTLIFYALYVVMIACSILYTSGSALGWNVAVIVSSIIIGGVMEGMGAREGVWSFYFGEPIALFMTFTWSLRVHTILIVSKILGYDLQQKWLSPPS